jgi:hypothetical protein
MISEAYNIEPDSFLVLLVIKLKRVCAVQKTVAGCMGTTAGLCERF